jgi:hypothetical protein
MLRFLLSVFSLKGGRQEKKEDFSPYERAPMTVGNPWTPEEDDVLAALWCSGVAATKIVDNFPGRTKNAIIGRVHRLKLERSLPDRTGVAIRPSARPKRQHPFQPKAPVVMPEPLPVPIPEPTVEDPETGVTLMELKSYHCRAILDLHGAPDGLAIYCGKRVWQGRSFCPDHMSDYYVPLQPRLRRR